jgi:hypothetical protein
MINGSLSNYCPKGLAAYYQIYNAVRSQKGLIHGRLHDNKGAHCAIGSFFACVNRDSALPNDIIDEVAGVNDSCRNLTPSQRKFAVLKYLRFKLQEAGMKL